MAYENIGLLLHDKKMRIGKLVEKDGSPSLAEKFFESGDEVWLTSATKASVTDNTAAACGTMIINSISESPLKKLWAIDASKGKENNKGIYFIDESGRPYTGDIHAMRIIRSGKRNFTDAYIGSVTSLASPVKELSATEGRIEIGMDTKVVNATTATFKDLWKVENTLYQKDSCYTVIKNETQYLAPSTTQLKLNTNIKYNSSYFDGQVQSSAIVTSFDYLKREYSFLGRYYRTKGILNFNFNTIPPDAIISSANLNFQLVDHGLVWARETHTFKCGPFTSCDRHNFDWANDHRQYGGNYNSVIKRINNPWDANTKYVNFSTTNQNQVGINTVPSVGSFISYSCTNLVKDVVEHKQPYYGFMFELQNPLQTNGYPHFYSILSSPSKPLTPTLEVNYQTHKDTCVKLCRDNITDTTNPYRWGILGNWRVDKTITYYSDRVEANAAILQTNTRKDGVLKEFTPYWNFTPASVQATTDTSRWVWNSASSLYNRKGVEVENYDPIGRYNAGLYGYNQTLPIVVAQNSKYREILFDGFEDYGYRTRYCDTACSVPREVDFINGNSTASVYDLESHTGNSSLLVQSSQAVFTAQLTPLVVDSTTAKLSAKVVIDTIFTTSVFGKGTGLSASYMCSNGRNEVQRIEGPLDIIYTSYSQTLPAPCVRSRYRASWTGKIQPKYSEPYSFLITTPVGYLNSSGAGLIVTDPSTNGVVARISVNSFGGSTVTTTNQSLVAGKLYDITVTYPQFNKSIGAIHLSWFSNRQQQEIIPQANLYPSNMVASDSAGSVISTIKEYCITPKAVIQTNIISPKFSPLQGKRMIVGAWMKTPAFCNPGTFTSQGQIAAAFNTGFSVVLEKTGLPVEGWQRYEAEVTVPATATQIYLRLTPGSSPMLVDDIRVQPYSSNMKAFVYDPVSLRLMSELDENNYASFYEYDDDGTLVRVKKETEKGIQTIKETRTSLSKK